MLYINIMLSFYKLHSLGNDFVLIDNPEAQPTEAQIKRMGDRHLGIGFDQLLVIRPLGDEHWQYRIFNQDGSEAGQCLNGARSVGLYLARTKQLERVILHAPSEQIEVDMRQLPNIEISVEWPVQTQTMHEGWFYELGNPHWIIDLTKQKWSRALIQKYYEQHAVNVSGIYRHHEHEISLCTYERGVGFTNACGSASVASFCALYEHKLCSSNLTIFQKGGVTQLYKKDRKVCSQSQAHWVYSGHVESGQQIFHQCTSTQNRYHGFKEIL